MLTTQSVTVQRGSRAILQDISLSVPPGQVLCILGANGAGKSTLLRVMSGDLTPTYGEVVLNETPLHCYASMPLARLRAFMPQSSPLTFPFTVREVVQMGRSPYGRDGRSQQDREIVDHALFLAGIVHLKERDYTTLSGGEKQRVHFARVLTQIWPDVTQSPRFLLLDEPVSSMDIQHQHETMRELRSLTTRGIGVAVVLHDLNLASFYGDQLAILKNGVLMAYGDPEAVLCPEIIQGAFSFAAHVSIHPDVQRPFVIPKVEWTPTETPASHPFR